jgi:hypothetical protein
MSWDILATLLCFQNMTSGRNLLANTQIVFVSHQKKKQQIRVWKAVPEGSAFHIFTKLGFFQK